MASTLLILAFALSPLPGLILGGAWLILTPALAFVVFPLLDLVLPRAKPTAIGGASTPLLHLYLPYHAVLILLGAAKAQDLAWNSGFFWLSALSVGIVTGAIGITFAHEWVHRRNPRQRLLGEWLLVWVGYGHYATEHVYGHHKNVGTREDGATARKGEWLQAFIVRALVQVWRGAFRIKPVRTILQGLATVGIAALIYFVFGATGVLFFAVQATVAILLLTSIDYVEHYGLERKRSADGRAESVKPAHSWDSDSLLMGELLIHLQRHADHHMKPLKPYPELELLTEAPRLPTGYAGMIWVAWWPHLWFRIMDPRIEIALCAPHTSNG
jgi:alkane 1-monooxygenase